MVHKIKKPCEACGRFESQWELVDRYGDAKTYDVCTNCLLPLVGNALSKEQFKNLLKSKHKKDEFLLHGDFYDEKGNALQPVKFR